MRVGLVPSCTQNAGAALKFEKKSASVALESGTFVPDDGDRPDITVLLYLFFSSDEEQTGHRFSVFISFV